MNIITGNLLDLAEAGEFDVIVQGCNCFCAMGSGIAGQIANRYPSAVEIDRTTHTGDYNKLGNFTSVIIDEKFVLVNAYTQYDTNSRDNWKDRFEYAAFELILKKISNRWPVASVGLPMIGMGLAGGNKERILSIIETFADDHLGTVTVVEYGGK